MYDCHRDSYIDSLIGKFVKIIDFCDQEHSGILRKYEYGRYVLEEPESDFGFRKSHIKSISKGA